MLTSLRNYILTTPTTEPTPACHLTELPNELLLSICEYPDATSLINLSRTCKKIHNILTNDKGKNLLERKINSEPRIKAYNDLCTALNDPHLIKYRQSINNPYSYYFLDQEYNKINKKTEEIVTKKLVSFITKYPKLHHLINSLLKKWQEQLINCYAKDEHFKSLNTINTLTTSPSQKAFILYAYCEIILTSIKDQNEAVFEKFTPITSSHAEVVITLVEANILDPQIKIPQLPNLKVSNNPSLFLHVFNLKSPILYLRQLHYKDLSKQTSFATRFFSYNLSYPSAVMLHIALHCHLKPDSINTFHFIKAPLLAKTENYLRNYQLIENKPATQITQYLPTFNKDLHKQILNDFPLIATSSKLIAILASTRDHCYKIATHLKSLIYK